MALSRLLQLHFSVAPFVAVAAGAALPLDAQKILWPVSATAVDGNQVRDELLKAEIIPHVIDDFAPAFLLSAQWSSKHQADLGNLLKPDKLQDTPSITLTPTVTTQLPQKHGRLRHSLYPHVAIKITSTPPEEEPCDNVFDKGTTSNMTYAIVLTDPDAPSYDDPRWSEFCHWIATGRVVVTPKPPRAVSSTTSFSYSAVSVLDGSDERETVDGCPRLELTGLKDVMPYKPPAPPEGTGRHRYVFLAFTPINATTEPLNVTRPGERKRWGTGKKGQGVRGWAEENGLVPIAANFIYAQNKSSSN